MSYAAVIEDPSAHPVHAMAEDTPVTMCGLEAASFYVVLDDFHAADRSMRCPRCEEAVGGRPR